MCYGFPYIISSVYMVIPLWGECQHRSHFEMTWLDSVAYSSGPRLSSKDDQTLSNAVSFLT